MPTGYTCDVQDGTVTEFKDFALGCARAFGACVTMRDEDKDTPIPDQFKASDYHQRQLAETSEKLKDILLLTDEECEVKAEEDHQRKVKSQDAAIAKDKLHQERYQAMLDKVNAWTPPTPDHEELKNFMRQQLTESMKFPYKPDPVEKQTGAEWKAEQIGKCEWSLEYHNKGHKEEVERIDGRNQWLKDLRESLNG